LRAAACIIVCGEEVDRQKPHPDLIMLGLKKAERAAPSAIMIGDTPFDIEASNGAGVASLGMLFSMRDLREAGCKAVYRDPAHLGGQLPEWTRF
jgi:phosphoglycolate phosphatase-like HAD superfamily hydrolase